MQFVQPEEISVDIEELSIRNATSGPQRWRVSIRVSDFKGLSLLKERDISDPLKTQSHHDQLRPYLNETLEMPFTPDHTKIEERLKNYPRILFKALNLDAYSAHLQGKKVYTWIRGIQLSSKISCGKPIHSLHWELLEDLSIWVSSKAGEVAKPASVTERRCVNALHVPDLQRDVIQAVQVGKPELFNVLLVVARRKVHEEEIDYLNPTSVLRAILEAQAELECRQSQKRIRLEVVRPRSYDEFRIHFQLSHKSFRLFILTFTEASSKILRLMEALTYV